MNRKSSHRDVAEAAITLVGFGIVFALLIAAQLGAFQKTAMPWWLGWDFPCASTQLFAQNALPNMNVVLESTKTAARRRCIR